MALNPRRTALLICDMQERFRGAISNFDHIAHTVSRMIKAAATSDPLSLSSGADELTLQLLEMKVITTEQNPKALGATVSELGLDKLPSHLNLGTFPKTSFTMFSPEVCKALGGRYANWHDASAKVDAEGIDSVIIVGIESHVCVFQTAMDNIRRGGPPPIIIADGVSSINPQEVGISLNRLRSAGADVGSSESVLFQLVGDAAHEKFRDVSKLVKEEKENTKGALKALFGP